MRNLIIKYSLVLLFLLVVIYLFVDYYNPLNLPEALPIPEAPIKILGLLISAAFLLVLWIAQKQLLKQYPDKTILQVSLYGSIIAIISESTFQILRVSTGFTGYTITEKLHYYLTGTLFSTIFISIFSFFGALQLKTKKTQLVTIGIVAVCYTIGSLMKLFPDFFKF